MYKNVKGYSINQICIMLLCEMKVSFENQFVCVKKIGFCVVHNIFRN